MKIIRVSLMLCAAIVAAMVISLALPFPEMRAIIIGATAGGAAICITLGLCFLLGIFRTSSPT